MKQFKFAFTLMFLFLFLSASLWAQEDQTNQINQIKRNSEYIYADKSDETKDGAVDLAKTILEIEVDRVMSEENITVSKSVVKENLAKHTHKIEVMRGGLFRAFLYISKAEAFSGGASQAAPAPVAAVDEAPQPLPEAPVIQEVKAQPTATVVPAEPEKTAPAAAPVERAVAGNTGNSVLDEMIGYTTVQSIQPFLEKKKQEGSIMYGKMQSLSNAENAYLIVYSKAGVIEAILGKGKDTRYNYLTGKNDDKLSDYPDKGVVWVQIFN